MKKKAKLDRVQYWVLKDGKSYFDVMTGIGPRGTPLMDEAARFTSKKAAMRSPAFTFSLANYKPHPVR